MLLGSHQFLAGRGLDDVVALSVPPKASLEPSGEKETSEKRVGSQFRERRSFALGYVQHLHFSESGRRTAHRRQEVTRRARRIKTLSCPKCPAAGRQWQAESRSALCSRISPVTGNREQGVVWRIGQRGNHGRGVVNHRLPRLQVALGFSRTVVFSAVANPSAKEVNLLGRKWRLAEGAFGASGCPSGSR